MKGKEGSWGRGRGGRSIDVGGVWRRRSSVKERLLYEYNWTAKEETNQHNTTDSKVET